MIKILDGKSLSKQLLEKQKLYIGREESIRRPKLVVITIGNDDASDVYLRNKRLACEKCDIIFDHQKYNDNFPISELKNIIQKLNCDNSVDGIIIQQPVPDMYKGLEQLIVPDKDVDGFTTYNLGGTLNGLGHMSACTANGIMELLQYNGIDLDGKHIVVIGRSNIVGKPLIGLLLSRNATVTSCNSHTDNLQGITLTADIIISAIGKPKFINSSYISTKCTCIIDVGINRDVDNNNKLCGDIDYESITKMWKWWEDNCDKTTRYITPVPGGVGPMTVYSLIKNTNIAYCKNVVNVLTGNYGGI